MDLLFAEWKRVNDLESTTKKWEACLSVWDPILNKHMSLHNMVCDITNFFSDQIPPRFSLSLCLIEY